MHSSGHNDIQDKYDVIVLNALYAWEGVSRKNENYITESRISDLKNRIDQLLEGREAMKTLLAPLSALERKIVRKNSYGQDRRRRLRPKTRDPPDENLPIHAELF